MIYQALTLVWRVWAPRRPPSEINYRTGRSRLLLRLRLCRGAEEQATDQGDRGGRGRSSRRGRSKARARIRGGKKNASRKRSASRTRVKPALLRRLDIAELNDDVSVSRQLATSH